MTWTMTKLSEKEQQLAPIFDRALAYRDEGNYEKAVELLETLVEQLTTAEKRLLSNALLQLGNAYEKLHKRQLAIDTFQRAIQIAPAHELASLCLYHSLDEQGMETDALNEMLRYLALRPSPMYRELLCPGFEDNMSEQNKALVSRARELLRGHDVN
jgi:tetratricopeptide (TPR) repeat protein